MKRIYFGLAALALSTGMALAAEPTGEWLVTDGIASIRVEKCGDQYWGVVSWEKEPGVDSNNPDPAKRTRPTLGMPVLLGMKATQPNRWDGQIYNSENGKTYTGNISLTSQDVLRVEGCLLIFCGGQDWTRVAKGSTTGRAGQSRAAGAAPQGSRPAASPTTQTAQEVCANVSRRMSLLASP